MTKKKNVLILEDNLILCNILKIWLLRAGYEVITSIDEPSARKKIREFKIDLILSDVRLPEGNGISFLKWCIQKGFNAPFIIMTEYASISDAVQAIKMGANDYLQKPVFEEKLLELLHGILGSPAIVRNKRDLFTRCSPAALETERLVHCVASTDLSVMILGPNGSGKESVALKIHNNSRRKNKPFIAVNCGSISKDLIASEFFGRIKGAYTGADSDSVGYFGTANGGTLFLDEIGNMPYEMQILLLRALQEKEYTPVGSNKTLQADIRILSATNEDMEKAILKGRFREDLFHRLAEFEIKQPGLSQCTEDIIPLAEFFRKKYAKEVKINSVGFSTEAKKAMLSYLWPGNIRELNNRVRRAILVSDNGIITCENLGLDINKTERFIQPLDKGEDDKIISALKRNNGNISNTAKELGISRTTLYKKIKKHNIKNSRNRNSNSVNP